ncbi:MAG: hypothetical protein HQL09_10250 [Nitrospirae bacterium]|nr:hypothetical protein [Nitrospirota bacterium]
MKNIFKIITAILVLVSFTGCGVSTGSIKNSRDKDFEFSDADKVKPGITEAQVVELLGKPASFGMDKQGRQYLTYRCTRDSTTTGMAIGPGVGTAGQSKSIKGFEVNIYLKDGLVQSVGYALYQEMADKELNY